MPFFIQILVYMFIILPALLLKEGYLKLAEYVKGKSWWDKLYVLLILLIILAVMLLMMGYR